MLGGLLPVGLVLVMFEPVEFVMFLPVKVHLYYSGLMYCLTQLRASEGTNDNPNTIIVLSIIISASLVFYK